MSQFKKYMSVINESDISINSFSKEKLAELLQITELEFNKKNYLNKYFMTNNKKEVVFKDNFDITEKNYLEFLNDMMPTFINSRSKEVNKYIVKFKPIAERREKEIKYINEDAKNKIEEINKIKQKKLDEIEDDANFLYSITENI